MSFSTAVRAPFRLTWRMVLRGLAWLLALLVLAALAGIVHLARSRWQDNEARMLEDPVAANYAALEYAIYDCIYRLGHSPADKDELLAMGVLELPKRKLWLNQDLVNPYTGGPVKFVEPGQQFQPGDCIYLPAQEWGPGGTWDIAFHLIVFSDKQLLREGLQMHYLVDFDQDGKPDPIAYCAGWISCVKYSGGGYGASETLQDTLIRLGLEQYWIGE